MLTATTSAVLAETSGAQYFIAFVAVCYYAFALWCGYQTIKKGHWVLFLLGLFFCGIFWFIGYFSVDRRAAAANDNSRLYGGLP